MTLAASIALITNQTLLSSAVESYFWKKMQIITHKNLLPLNWCNIYYYRSLSHGRHHHLSIPISLTLFHCIRGAKGYNDKRNFKYGRILQFSLILQNMSQSFYYNNVKLLQHYAGLLKYHDNIMEQAISSRSFLKYHHQV